MKKHILRCYKGFTLIELLIVVAIIAILAAIAVPNFLEAQTRAKNARNLGELRTLATVLETYKIDNNAYPPRGAYDRAGTDHHLVKKSGYSLALDPIIITTPIAYLSSEQPTLDLWQAKDLPMQTAKGTSNWVYGRYRYTASKQNPENTDATEGILTRRYGGWRLLGAGPDTYVFNDTMARPSPAATYVIPYDATNGTVSVGDTIRSQKETVVTLQSTLLP